MKFCPNCGSQLPENVKFCPGCGAAVATAPAAPAQNFTANTDTIRKTEPAAPAAPAAASYAAPYAAPAQKLRTNRGLLKLILLSAITFGIYAIVVMCHISEEINTVASRYDGKKTMHYLLVMLVFSWLTFGIVPLVWEHRICNRYGNELKRRGIAYSFGAGTFWGWGILGSLLFGIGPFIFIHKFMKAANLVNADYNVKG